VIERIVAAIGRERDLAELVAAPDLHASAVRAKLRARADSDEAVAAPVFAALVRLEQEREAPVVDRQEDRKGGVEVG
jgi:hypothetical protein